MAKAFAVLVLLALSAPACSLARSSAVQATTAPHRDTAVQRAVRDLQHARFGPWAPSKAPMLRNVQCSALSTSRVACHASYDGRPAKTIVFGVKPGGALYVIVAGPLAIS